MLNLYGSTWNRKGEIYHFFNLKEHNYNGMFNLDLKTHGDDIMKLTPQRIIPLEDGKHSGTIVKITQRHEPYEYTDIHVRPDKAPDMMLKAGYPSNLTLNENGSPRSNLAKQLNKLMIDVTKEVNTDALIDKKVDFNVINEEGKDGNVYARIVKGSLKPKK